jgi:hypothetical protein
MVSTSRNDRRTKIDIGAAFFLKAQSPQAFNDLGYTAALLAGS